MTVNRIFSPDPAAMDELVEALHALLGEEPGEQNPPPTETCLQPEPE